MQAKLITMAMALLLVVVAKAENKKVTPELKHVTVFTNGAQVERTSSMNLLAGEQIVTFTGLSPYTDVKSMQIKAHGKLTVLGVNYRTIHPDSLQWIKQLRDAEQKVKQTDDKEREMRSQLEVVNAQLEMLKTNCSTGNRTAVTPLANIKELNTYYAQEMLELKKKAIAIDQELVKLAEIREKQQKTADSIAHLRLKTITEAELKLQVPQACKVDFTLTYYVRNAGWYPTYDLRSEGVGQPLQLSYKANMFQNTKEEWKNIPVTLSSANPNRSNVAPELRTYWLDYGRSAPRYNSEEEPEGSVYGVVTDDKGEVIIGAIVTVQGTSLGTVTDSNGRYSITLPRPNVILNVSYIGYLTKHVRVNKSGAVNVKLMEDNTTLNDVVVVGYGTKKKTSSRKLAKLNAEEADEGEVLKSKEMIKPESDLIAVKEQKAQFGYEFEIKQPLTMTSDGKTTTTEIARYQLPATYQYLGIPRADKDAFLVADATEWQQYSLLEGEANVYFENSFVGKTILDPTVVNDTLHFSLGRDNGIRIQRTKVSDRSTRRLLSTTQEQNLTWRITVKNSRKEAVSLTLRDQIPVSENSNITVTTEELSGGKLNDTTGIVEWQLQLQPNEQRELTVAYRVKYPKSRWLNVE